MLDLLLQALKMGTGLDFHDRENDAGDDEREPKEERENLAPPVNRDGEGFLDHVDVASLLVDRISCFI